MFTHFLKLIIPGSCLMLLFIPSPAQPFPCGTTVTPEQAAYEAALEDSVTRVTGLNRTLHLALYIVKDNKGQTNVDPAALTAAIEQVNAAFDPVGITFAVHTLTYIDNYHFDEIRMGVNEKSMRAQYAVPGFICLYLVNKLYGTGGQEICGYTYYPSASEDVILLRKACLNGAFLAEQMGHFFNLYHMHETAFGTEYVDRSNCQTSGDRCCDTPADPGLTGLVTSDCRYNGTGRDAHGSY